MSNNAAEFDHWIRNDFADINTELETLYMAENAGATIPTVGEKLREQLYKGGHDHIVRLLNEGNTDEGFDAAFDLLGNVGLYMGACRRHEITEPSREHTSPLVEASGLAMHIGASLGVAPRFATSHLSTHSLAIAGNYKSFTHLPDEKLFLEYNTRGIFAYKRAADALVRTIPLGISHPVTYDLLVAAKAALEDVAAFNSELFAKLDTDQFFYCVRPYYKPYRVGRTEYRGANAGDFAGINEIDLLLGLCRAQDPSYAQLLVDKFLYMVPSDQERLRDCMRRESILDQLLVSLSSSNNSDWFEKNANMFLEVCAAHGETARQHHDQLVSRFIVKPSADLPPENMKGITASGPPLEVLIQALEKLKNQRCANNVPGIGSRYDDIQAVKTALSQS